MLTLVLAESALELVPKELVNHPLVVRDAKRRHKRPEELLLDRSYHHRAMTKLVGSERRGRPDVVHITLLTSLGSPLNLEGKLRIYIHTVKDRVISLSPQVRIPRNTERFKGLIEELFASGRVPSGGEPLLESHKMNLPQLIKAIEPSHTVGLTVRGESRSVSEIAASLARENNPVVLIGGFPIGHFSIGATKLANETMKIYPKGLEAWTVASWMIFAYGLAAGLN